MTKMILFLTFMILSPSLLLAKLDVQKVLLMKSSQSEPFDWDSSEGAEDFVNFFETQDSDFCSDYCGEDQSCYETCISLENVYQSTSTNETSVATVCSLFCGNFHVLGCFNMCVAIMNAQSILNKIHQSDADSLDFKPTYEEQKIEEWEWDGESANKGIDEYKNYDEEEEDSDSLNLDIDISELVNEESKQKQKDNFLQMRTKHRSVVQSMLQTASEAQDSHYSNYYIDCEIMCEGDENCEDMCEEANDQYLEVNWNLPDTCEDFCNSMVPIQMPVWEGERDEQEYDKCIALCEKYDLVDLVN